ncbi:hypothetical protein Lser_V15G02991 [Lactuca serriola]
MCLFVPGKPPVDYQGAREAKPITEFALKQVKTLLKDKLSGKTTITESSVQCHESTNGRSWTELRNDPRFGQPVQAIIEFPFCPHPSESCSFVD